MTRQARDMRLVAAFVVAVFVVALFIVGVSAMAAPGDPRHDPASTATGDLLPDLDQEAPSELAIRTAVDNGQTIWVLGFRSAVRNIGAGPLTIEGSRSNTDTPAMAVTQLVNRIDAPTRVVRNVGTLQFVTSPDHDHWHYMQFDRYELLRYELRSAYTDAEVATDRKTGFCLGDRYAVPLALPAAPSQPVYTGSCGLDRPGLLTMREGISVGYGDDYSAFLEGQDLPISGLPDGRYVLVHRVNADGLLEELSSANNAASLLLELSWRQGTPHIRVLDTCPDTAECQAPVEASGGRQEHASRPGSRLTKVNAEQARAWGHDVSRGLTCAEVRWTRARRAALRARCVGSRSFAREDGRGG